MSRLMERVRRVYLNLVTRRSIVRIVDSTPTVEMSYPPVFLVGVFRSGTTLLRYVVDSHSHICCPPETEFVPVLQRLVNDSGQTQSLGHMGFDRQHVVRKLRELCLYFYQNYAVSCGKPRWADKSPGYVDYLDFIQELFPEGRFVMIYRHGLDQAHSLVRAGFLHKRLMRYCREGEDLRLGAVRYWVEKAGKMIEFETRNPGRCVRIRYEDMCRAPEEELRRVFAFIDEPWEPRVLRFHDFPHDQGYEDGRVSGTRGFAISAGHYHQWPGELVEEALRLAGDTLHLLAYDAH